LKFVRGEFGTGKDQRLSQQITRAILCGNSTIQPDKADEVLRGSYRTQELNKTVYSTIDKVLDQFELFLDKLTAVMDVDIMPGRSDFSSAFMPQQPINSCLFPLLKDRMSMNLTTNPHNFKINDIQFLGTSGQNIDDIFSYSKLSDSPIELLKASLEMRHICPTAPDTLRSFPFVTEDPFIIDGAPHVYFAGNQSKYESKLIKDNVGRAVRTISIPSFRQTGTVVFVDLETLESYPYKIDVSDIVESSSGSGTSASETE
jgi:DNA polymerase delta subunit 2